RRRIATKWRWSSAVSRSFRKRPGADPGGERKVRPRLASACSWCTSLLPSVHGQPREGSPRAELLLQPRQETEQLWLRLAEGDAGGEKPGRVRVTEGQPTRVSQGPLEQDEQSVFTDACEPQLASSGRLVVAPHFILDRAGLQGNPDGAPGAHAPGQEW